MGPLFTNTNTNTNTKKQKEKDKNMNTRLKILGVNDDMDTCSCCGKRGLKKVVWIQDMDTGDIAHFGTTCATKRAPLLFGKGESAKVAGDKNIRNLCSFIHYRLLPQTEEGKAAEAALQAAEGKDWAYRKAHVFPSFEVARKVEESIRIQSGLSIDGRAVEDWGVFATALDAIDWS